MDVAYACLLQTCVNVCALYGNNALEQDLMFRTALNSPVVEKAEFLWFGGMVSPANVIGKPVFALQVGKTFHLHVGV